MLLPFISLWFAYLREVNDPCLHGVNHSSKCIIVGAKQHSGEGTVKRNYNFEFHLHCAPGSSFLTD
jgi:hypothetical protein